MAKLRGIYKCNVCGNIVEVLHSGGGTLVCCGEDMHLMTEKNSDEGQEKHVPIITVDGSTITVKVGSIPHPMEDKHYIEWIELSADGKFYKKYLNPGDAPEAVFCLEASQYSARIYCNIHGLWQSI